jgi:hypothetical protein
LPDEVSKLVPLVGSVKTGVGGQVGVWEASNLHAYGDYIAIQDHNGLQENGTDSSGYPPSKVSRSYFRMDLSFLTMRVRSPGSAIRTERYTPIALTQ